MLEWIAGIIEKAGYVGIGLLMLLENVFPPIPSELIMPLSGFVAARGHLHAALVLVAGTVGSVLGALLWYYAGRWLGMDRLKALASRHGRWLTVSPADLEKAQAFFLRHCGTAVFIGRLIPGVRTLISVPAGIVKMPLPQFLLYSFLGTATWNAILVGAGYWLESQYRQVAEWMNPVVHGLFGILAFWYLYRVVTFRPK
jgi:membrane protein DedA with SNARE-associated domain